MKIFFVSSLSRISNEAEIALREKKSPIESWQDGKIQNNRKSREREKKIINSSTQLDHKIISEIEYFALLVFQEEKRPPGSIGFDEVCGPRNIIINARFVVLRQAGYWRERISCMKNQYWRTTAGLANDSARTTTRNPLRSLYLNLDHGTFSTISEIAQLKSRQFHWNTPEPLPTFRAESLCARKLLSSPLR